MTKALCRIYLLSCRLDDILAFGFETSLLIMQAEVCELARHAPQDRRTVRPAFIEQLIDADCLISDVGMELGKA